MEWHGYSDFQDARNEYLEHHGVKGQKWGVRRYERASGKLTMLGKYHYKKEIHKGASEEYKALKKTKKAAKQAYKEGTLSKDQYKDVKNLKGHVADMRYSTNWDVRGYLRDTTDVELARLMLKAYKSKREKIEKALNGPIGNVKMSDVKKAVE